ncbi:MAG: tetratricopeptide repeat protein [candidate division KSB1 bacterium]|nr:tetratricopeptide repeat protein [candidate division KSB1 bacterium]MDZ7310869.1 tetratricopeptide repeat protein [candidate division KSB1 bacterium]
MQLPEGSAILIIGWGFVVLILWNLYHFSRALRKTTFLALLTLASLGLLGAMAFLHVHQRPSLPGNRLGLLIFPFVEETDGPVAGEPVFRVEAQGLAIADMIGEHMRQMAPPPFYIIPTDALFEVANRDSLSHLDYALRFAARAALPMIGFGTYRAKRNSQTNQHESWQAEFQLFDLRKLKAGNKPAGVHLKLPDQFDSLHGMAAAHAHAIFQVWPGNAQTATTTIWQDHTPVDLLQRYYSARLTLGMNQPESALRQARALWRADSNSSRFVNLYARALMAHLQHKAASKMEWQDSLHVVLPFVKNKATADARNGESARLLGEIYIRLEKWREAEHALLQARRRDSTDSKIYVLLAQLHVSRLKPLGFRTELDLYLQALLLNPLDFDAGLAAADYLFLENREQEAITLLEKMRSLSPNHLGVLMSLGRIYIVKGETLKIFEVHERVLKLSPNNADAYYNLGIAYYNREDFENAIKLFERAIALNNHIDARMYLAFIHERQGKIDKAIAYLRERIQLSRGDDDKFADEARKHLYEILLARGEIPPSLRPDSLRQP